MKESNRQRFTTAVELVAITVAFHALASVTVEHDSPRTISQHCNTTTVNHNHAIPQ